jgi:hypothetical protein
MTFGRAPLAFGQALPPGDYVLAVALYEARTGQALSVLDVAGNPMGDLCAVGSVEHGSAAP